MYTLAIIDDEAMIRKGLSSIISWESMGFELIGAYEDGAEIISVLQTRKVDVLLCDIKMKTVSGIDVAKYIYDRHLDTQILLLSAYQEFELAQQALQYRVYGYLLKPTDIAELKETFQKLKLYLDELSTRQDQVKQRNEHLSKSMELIYDLLFCTGHSDSFDGDRALDPSLHIHGNAQVFAYLLEHDAKDGALAYTLLRDAFASERNHLVNAHVMERGPDSCFLLAWGDRSIQNIDQFVKDRLHLISFNAHINFQIRKSRSIVQTAPGHAGTNLTYNNQDILEVVDRLIDEHLSEKITLESLCQQIYMNPSYFSRYFKQKKDVNFSEYLLNRRIEHAKKLIQTGDMYIYKVCSAVGIRNYKYFHKVFKSAVGCSPIEYKERTAGDKT